jgi:CelD/BcsL family acetyltransferase involved in cellulose biosynthesis
MDIEVLKDGEVLPKLADEAFRQDWQSLYEHCPWATGYQSPEYVTCWYRLYETKYRPVVLTASAADGSLVGMLALALDAQANALVGAGGEDTVYQVWLATPETSDEFMQGVLSLLRKRFRRYHLHLKYLAPGTPLNGLRSNAGLVRCTFSNLEPRPYMRTDAECIAKSFNGKTNRNLFNRLKRLGEVSFTTVTDPDQLDGALEEYIRQYDFRQAAMYDFPPFRVDPAKKMFYRALLAAGMLHVSVLKVGESVVSLNIGLKSKDGVQIGIAHSPLYADYSPGRLHIYMLCMALAKEGYAYFDLTPGAGYKAQLATDTDEVCELSALSALQTLQLRQRARMRRLALACLGRLGISTTAARLAMSRARKTARHLLSGVVKPPLPDRYCVYQAAPPLKNADASPLRLQANRIDDLLHYDEAAGMKSYHEFQYEAMKRLESRQHVYTSTDSGRLVFCAWVGRRAEMEFGRGAADMPPQEGDAIAVYDIYRHSQAACDLRLDSLLKHISHDIHDRFNAGTVELVLHAHDSAARTEAERAGFRLVEPG